MAKSILLWKEQAEEADIRRDGKIPSTNGREGGFEGSLRATEDGEITSMDPD